MSSFHSILKSYSEYHQHPKNRLTHKIGVPLATLNLMIVFGWFRFAHMEWLSLATLTFVGLAIYYLKLDLRLGLLTVGLMVPLYLVADYISVLDTWTSVYFAIGTFVVGWAFQLAGHYFEGRRPALADNLLQVLAAPLFVVAEFLVAKGQRKDLAPYINLAQEKA